MAERSSCGYVGIFLNSPPTCLGNLMPSDSEAMRMCEKRMKVEGKGGNKGLEAGSEEAGK